MAVSVTVEVPGRIGVPLIAPVEEFSVRPKGRPLAPKLVAEPEAAIVNPNGAPTVAAGVTLLLMMTGAEVGATVVIVSVEAPVPAAFVALMNTNVVPALSGVPVIAPVAGTMLKPPGSPPAE